MNVWGSSRFPEAWSSTIGCSNRSRVSDDHPIRNRPAMNPLRKAILAASASPWLRERAPRYRFIRRTVERFLPGEQVEDALSAARRLAQNQIDSLLTHLGENVSDRVEAEAITLHYLDLLERLENTSLPSELSVKL